MDADRFRSLAETAPPDLRQKLLVLPSIVADWLEPHGGLAGRKIMDFGCGLGELAAGLAFSAPTASVIGLEVTDQPTQLPTTLEPIGLALPPNLSFREVALGEVGDENEFDLIVSWSVFEHIQRNQFNAVMARLKTRLKPGGLLFMQVSPLFFSPEGSHFWALGYTELFAGPVADLAEAIDAVKTGACDCALIPVENSTIGVVEPAATLVAQSGLPVVAEVWRKIQIALMANPGAELADLKTVHSHPVALRQCTGKISALGLQIVEAFDTAGAAREVADLGDRTRAALAPVAAAEVYGLSILRNDVQDSDTNRTRFVLLAREPG
jgi:prephenate dehydratase